MRSAATVDFNVPSVKNIMDSPKNFQRNPNSPDVISPIKECNSSEARAGGIREIGSTVTES